MRAVETRKWLQGVRQCRGRWWEEHLGHWGRLGTGTGRKPAGWGQERRKCLLYNQNCSNNVLKSNLFCLKWSKFSLSKVKTQSALTYLLCFRLAWNCINLLHRKQRISIIWHLKLTFLHSCLYFHSRFERKNWLFVLSQVVFPERISFRISLADPSAPDLRGLKWINFPPDMPAFTKFPRFF